MRFWLPFLTACWWGYGCLLALPLAAPAQALPASTDYLAPLKTKDLSQL